MGDEAGSSGRGDDADVREPTLRPDAPQGKAPASDRTKRKHETQSILVDAAQRDDDAQARDVRSDQREMAADLEAFLDTDEAYRGVDDRRAAALDRSHAKDDREASARDRIELTKHDPDLDAGGGPTSAP